jgi:hypothetical protein
VFIWINEMDKSRLESASISEITKFLDKVRGKQDLLTRNQRQGREGRLLRNIEDTILNELAVRKAEGRK